MKRLIHLVCLVVLFTACSEKEEFQDCIGIIDFIGPPGFQLKFVDNNENNLIENEYFDSDIISSSINGQSYTGQIVGFDSEPFQNIVILPPGIGNEGKNTWILKLSESEIDTLNFTLVYREVKQDGLCGTNSSVETATYNGNAIDLNGSNSYCLTIIKSIE